MAKKRAGSSGEATGPAAAPTAGVDPQVAAAIEQLTPAEAAKVLAVLERAMTRRRIQLAGYLTGGVVLLLGTVAALIYYGRAQQGEFVGWAFLLPLGLCGLVLLLFARWSDRYRTVVDERAARARERDR